MSRRGVLVLAGAWVAMATALAWAALDYRGRAQAAEFVVGEMCGLKVVIPLEGPTELESFVNAQTFPAWCGPDPHAFPVTEVRPTA